MMLKENQIVDIDGYVHVVNGKVICFKEGVYDLANEEDVSSLLRLSSKLFVSKIYPAIYGEDTMAVMLRHPDGVNRILSMSDIAGLPIDVQQKVRSVINEFIGT